MLNHGHVRQYGSLRPSEKKLTQKDFDPKQTNWLKDASSNILHTTLIEKMLTLAVNKFALLDSQQLGVEMEGGKPGWNDAMNGLPAMFAGSMPETFELKRLLSFLSQYSFGHIASLPVEVAAFLRKTAAILKEFPAPLPLEAEDKGNTGNADFSFWEAVGDAREEYRKAVYSPLSGEMTEIGDNEIGEFLSAALNRVEAGIDKAKAVSDGKVPTYFTYEAVDYEVLDTVDGSGRKNVRVKGFKVMEVPRFLEGPARYLAAGAKDAKAVHEDVKNSDLYDKKLKMFKTGESIEKLSHEYGRVRAFTPGWLERESIFLHMEYKYLFALLKNGLYDEFYEASRTAMIPFMDPAVYGRSILENSSFIASSENPDERVHGRGYVARLSGSTTELIGMWIRMFIGDKVFRFEDNELKITFAPALPGDFFTESGVASWTFMGQTRVVYHNPSRKPTYGPGAAKAISMKLLTTQGETVTAKGDTLTGENALRLRNGDFVRIDAEME